jgi:hypothetical protein
VLQRILGIAGFVVFVIVFAMDKYPRKEKLFDNHPDIKWACYALSVLLIGIAGYRQFIEPLFVSKNKNPTVLQLKEPRFSESVEYFYFSLGGGGMSCGYNKNVLENSHMNNCFVLNNYRPVDLYIENGQLYADVSIYGGRGLPPIEIKKNKLSNKPEDWDFNSNTNAMEIVNEHQLPIYQFFYKTPSHIVMNGIFPFSDGYIMGNESGAIVSKLPTAINLKRLFKYPSWKFPGEYEE